MDTIITQLGVILYATLLFTPPLLYAAIGSCFSEVSGVVNIGIEGMMTAGAFVGCVVAHFTGNPFLGFVCGGLAGSFFGLLHAIASINLGANQVISGTAINMLAPAMAIMLSYSIFGAGDTVPLPPSSQIPILFQGVFGDDTIGKFLKNVFATYPTTYLVFILVAVTWFIFYKTRFGLRIRACGEHPLACETLGIDVMKMRFICVILSGFFAGLGGAVMTMAITNQFRPISIVGQGFIAIASVIFGKFRPQGALIGCLLFGFCTGLKVVFKSQLVSVQIVSMIPYIVTIIALVLFVGKAHVPKANGQPYIKAR